MRCAEEWRQIRLSNQSPPKLQWCSTRVQNAYMRPGPCRQATAAPLAVANFMATIDHSELALLSPNFLTTPTGGRLTPMYDLTCNRPNTRHTFSGLPTKLISCI
ncbi:hypothetical protein AVEN_134289-1 [Araneus ventricosus]|uniref:Uncharacterized protein n=1 Tax=Araneus ventricosus TaxID=182803 RepID=A0A4Y2L0X3_ARAVE|nr:hypothetical protein AVEN_134289-1 [Araneus ventricosus]